MSIVKTVGTIVRVTDLTKTAKEVTIKTEAQINFIPGQFVNLFMEIGGEKVRRAYSIVYRDYFESLAKNNPKVKVLHVISKPTETCALAKGYIQDNIEQFDFNNSDVYVCGQDSACNQLVEKIKEKNPVGVNYLIEGFH